MLRLAASRCAPFLRSRHNQAGRPCVGQPGGWPRRSGGGLATAARTLCAARQRRRGASLRVAASPLPRARRAQRARQTCLTLVSVPPRGLQPVNDSCRLYSLLAYIVACIYTPRLISANTPPLSTGSADAAPTAAPPQRRSYKPRRPVPKEVPPERKPSVHTGHEGHACSAASPMSSKPIETKHGVSANHAPSTAAPHTALLLAAAAAGGPTLRDAVPMAAHCPRAAGPHTRSQPAARGISRHRRRRLLPAAARPLGIERLLIRRRHERLLRGGVGGGVKGPV